MSKESIQEVVQQSLEEYFNDLGELQPSNVYDMVVLSVEKPMLKVVMARAEGNQLTLTVSRRWLDSRPLIRADLEGEPEDMAGLGITLKLEAA